MHLKFDISPTRSTLYILFKTSYNVFFVSIFSYIIEFVHRSKLEPMSETNNHCLNFILVTIKGKQRKSKKNRESCLYE